jgi:hypothetical protein
MIKRLLLLLAILFGIVVVLSLFKEKNKGINPVLTRGWKFHGGDNPEWANPGFDDNSWTCIVFSGRDKIHNNEQREYQNRTLIRRAFSVCN